MIGLSWLLTSGIWVAVGLYKLTHFTAMSEVVRAHGIPFPKLALALSIAVELAGVALLVFQQVWIACLIWLGFLAIATPIFHGNVLSCGTINYSQYVHFAKNLSIAGGLIALLLLDGTMPNAIERTWQSLVADGAVHSLPLANLVGHAAHEQ